MPPKDLTHRATCGNCRFWDRLPDPDQRPGEDVEGECCFDRPRIVVDDGGFTQASILTPSRRRACGDHQPEVH